MNLKTLQVLLLLFFWQLSVFGQEQDSTETKIVHRHAMGLSIGTSIGVGPTYRYMSEKFGFQVAFAPNINSTRKTYSSAITFFMKLKEKEKMNIYLYQANHYLNFYSSEKDGKDVYEYFFVNGIGAGIEFIINKRIAYNFMLGGAGYKNFKWFYPSVEMSLLFKF